MATELTCIYCGRTFGAEDIVFAEECSSPAEGGSVDIIYEGFVSKYNYPQHEPKLRKLYTVADAHPQASDFRSDALTCVVTRRSDDIPLDAEHRSYRTNALNEGTWDAVTLSMRLCPHCHCLLPTRFGLNPVHSVVLLGGSGSGKTVFMISALQQLQQMLPIGRGLSLASIVFDNVSRAYYNDMIGTYETGELKATDQRSLFPLVFSVHSATDAQVAYVCVYDFAGETFGKNTEEVSGYINSHNGIRNAQVAILMVDPHQIASIELGDEETHHCKDNLGESFAHFSDFLHKAENLEEVLCVLSKVDLMLTNRMIPGHTRFAGSDMAVHKGGVDTRELDLVDLQVQEVLNRHLVDNGANQHAKSFISRNLKGVPVRMFAVSAFTRIAQPDGAISFEDNHSPQAGKHRIIEPFLYLFAKWGIVPTKQAEPVQPQKSGRNSRQRRGLLHRLFGW